MSRRSIGSIALLTLIAVGTVSPVTAAPILYSRATASAQNQDVIGFPSDLETTGVLNNVDTTPLVDAASGLASSYASVTDGVLSTYASAGSLVNGIQGQVATGQAEFVDTLTLVSSTLAAGTPVTLMFSLGLDATSSGNGLLGCGESNADMSLYVLGGSVSVAAARESSCPGSSDYSTTSTRVFSIGDEITVQVGLRASASARAGATSFADAAHTLHFFVNPLGDFSYTTLSGNSYLTPDAPAPVPEPASLLLVGSGATAFLGRRLRHRFRNPRH